MLMLILAFIRPSMSVHSIRYSNYIHNLFSMYYMDDQAFNFKESAAILKQRPGVLFTIIELNSKVSLFHITLCYQTPIIMTRYLLLLFF